MNINLTEEQREIVLALARRERLKVFALAGTGKTTTLKAIAEVYPRKRMLYLAFNKAIAAEARRKFGRNVEVRTVHSLAYVHLGKSYEQRLSRLEYYEIADTMGIPVREVFEQIPYFNQFVNSGCSLNRSDIISLVRKKNCPDPYRTASFMIKIFDALKNNCALHVDHNFYLKDFQLNFSEYGLAENYDVVLLDEGQDVNPVIMAIFEQFKAKKVMVGDRHQKIYGFRGAVNAIEDFDADETLHLTCTFRFNGRQQVQAVNDLLFHLKCEDNVLRPVGNGGDSGSRTGCVITRSNAKLIETLLETPGLKTVRHPDQYFERFFNIFARKIRIPDDPDDEMTFGSYLGCLEDMAETVDDFDLLSSLKLIKRNACDLRLFKRLYEQALKNYGNGRSTYLGTAHTTKGLEFDVVKLTDDFKTPRGILQELLEAQPELCRGRRTGFRDKVLIRREDLRKLFARMDDDLMKEEINLLYVALTRAKKEIEIPWKYMISDEYQVEVPGSGKPAGKSPLF